MSTSRYRGDSGGAQGAVRDAVAGLQNLHVLLRSPRVGPRPIAAVLPELRDGLGPLDDAAGALLAPLGDDPLALAVGRELRAFVALQRDAVVRELSRAEASGIDAKSRLALEAEIERITPLIDAARLLLDLLFASTEPPVELDLSEMLDEALSANSQRGALFGAIAAVSVLAPERGAATLLVSPRVAIPLLGLAVGHVHRDAAGRWKTPAPRLQARVEVPVSLEVGPPPEGGPRLDAFALRPPVIVAPCAAALRLLEARTGVSLRLDPDRPAAHLRLPSP